MSEEEKIEFKKYLVKISHKLSRIGVNIIEWKGRYFKIKELG